MATEHDPTKGLMFDLPDGETITLCSWDYIRYQLSLALDPIVADLTSCNASLQRIDDKLKSWAPENT